MDPNRMDPGKQEMCNVWEDFNGDNEFSHLRDSEEKIKTDIKTNKWKNTFNCNSGLHIYKMRGQDKERWGYVGENMVLGKERNSDF